MIGRPEQISLAAGLHEKTSYGWRSASRTRGAGDIPSAQIMRKLLAYARIQGLPLTAEHLVIGAPESDVLALLEDARVAPQAAE